MKALHVGRSWPGMGNPLEVTCPCPKEPCGLVALDRANPNCLQHPVNRIKTMRQIHVADMCPGISVQTVEQERDEARAEVERLRELNAAAERARQDALPFVNAAPALILEVERLRSQLAVQTLKEIEDTKKVMPKLAPHITDTYGKYTLDVYDLVVNSQDCRIVIRVGDDVKYEMKYPAYKVWTFIAHWKELAEVADAHDDDVQDNLADANYTIRALRSVLADRERELLVLKGPCSTTGCPLHYAHSGPCNIRPIAEEQK